MIPHLKPTQAVLVLLLYVITTTNLFAQVGIGTTTPDSSSILDLTSDISGLLPPRMSTDQRTAIGTPAEGLVVYDTNIHALYIYSSSKWQQLSASVRNNYKLIKSTDNLASVLASELAAGGGVVYKMNSNYLYEINGKIVFDYPINLNGANIIGQNPTEDQITISGQTLLTGIAKGRISTLTLSAPGGTVFDLNSGEAVSSNTGTNTLSIFSGYIMNANSVGTIQNTYRIIMDRLFFINNKTGITYSNIGKLVNNENIWQSSNTGTFETYTGSFSVISKATGFMNVSANGIIGIDVSSNPTILDAASLQGVTFLGSSNTYVKGYTSGSYPGFHFNDKWMVNCAGIPIEEDDMANGSTYDSSPSFSTTADTPITTSSGAKLNIHSQGTGLQIFRVSSPEVNRLQYNGNTTRIFQVTSILSAGDSGLGPTGSYAFIFFFTKNGIPVPGTETYMQLVNASQSLTVSGFISMSKGDYVELWVKQVNGYTGHTVSLYSYNMAMK